MRRALFLSLVLSLVGAGTSAAQTCLGLPSFAEGRLAASAGGSFPDGSTTYVGGIGYGAPESLFGTAGYAYTDYDGIDASSSGVNLGAGYQVPLGTGKAEVCPVVSASFGWGPDDLFDSGLDVRNRSVAAGAAIGVQIGNGSRVRLVPSAGLLLANSRVTLDDGTESVSDSDTYGILALGTGFVFGGRFSLTPTVTIPVGLGGSDPTFGVTAAVHFGR